MLIKMYAFSTKLFKVFYNALILFSLCKVGSFPHSQPNILRKMKIICRVRTPGSPTFRMYGTRVQWPKVAQTLLTLLDSGRGGGGQICHNHHIFACTRVCMRIQVLIFCDFSSFLVWKRVQKFSTPKKSPFSQELKKLVQFA